VQTILSPPIAVGIASYAIGLSVEAISEFQRKAFKQDPKNKGNPYGGGLFSLATNINYGAYTIWRAAYACTCGGFIWGATTFTFFFRDFATRGVPVLDEYMTQRVSL
jgi:steroid 5-alpha reductase family enzyme